MMPLSPWPWCRCRGVRGGCCSDGRRAGGGNCSRLPVDETAKDDGLAVAVGLEVEPIEPEMQGDAAPAEARSGPSNPLPADPVAKDDGLATDLGGATVPINGAPKLGDDKAAINATVEPATVAN